MASAIRSLECPEMTTDHTEGAGESGLRSQSAADPGEIAALYDRWAAADYDADLEAWNYEAPARAASIVAEALAGAAGARILDAGCGTGLVGAALRALDAGHIVGGDFSPSSVDVARLDPARCCEIAVEGALSQRFRRRRSQRCGSACHGSAAESDSTSTPR